MIDYQLKRELRNRKIKIIWGEKSEKDEFYYNNAQFVRKKKKS